MRVPGFQKIKRNDIVVFNQPADTLPEQFRTAKYSADKKALKSALEAGDKSVGLCADLIDNYKPRFSHKKGV